ncbi:MAG: TolC family protein [Rhodothermia bacterium]|nr:TolC family protein [Rhodothermia bacterium]
MTTILFRGGFRSLLATLIPLVLVGSAAGQSTVPDSVLHVEDVVRSVLADNPLLRASTLKADALQQTISVEKRLDDPLFAVAVSPRPIHTARGAQRSQWRIEQTIPFPGKRKLRGEVASLRFRTAEMESAALANDAVLHTRQVYANLFALQERLRIVSAFRSEVQRFEEAAATQYEVGRGHQQAILRAQLEKNTLSQRGLSLRAERQREAAALARLVNRPDLAEGLFRVSRPLDLERVPDNASPEAAIESRPDLIALRTAGERADKAAALAQKQSWPDLNLSVIYTDIVKSSPPANPDGVDAIAVGAGVRIPIWRGPIRARIQEQRIVGQQIDAQLEALQTAISTEFADLVSRITISSENLTLLEQGLIRQAEITRDATLSAYTTGQAGFIDLLDAERALYSLRMEETTVRSQLHHAVAELLWSLGRDINY